MTYDESMVTQAEIRELVLPVIGACLLMRPDDRNLADEHTGAAAEVAKAVVKFLSTRTAAQPEREAVTQTTESMVTQADRDARRDFLDAVGWSCPANEQNVLDEAFARHRTAAQSEREAVLEVPREGSDTIFEAIRKARDSGCSIRNLWDDIVRAALAKKGQTDDR